jgi:hypothetical protein
MSSGHAHGRGAGRGKPQEPAGKSKREVEEAQRQRGQKQSADLEAKILQAEQANKKLKAPLQDKVTFVKSELGELAQVRLVLRLGG